MAKLKNLLLMGLSLVLVASLAVVGTVAYLSDTDSDVNVMTLGNVRIEQVEYQRVVNDDGTYETAEIDGVDSYVLEPFEQAKPLLPIVGDPSKDGTEYENAGWDSITTRLTQVGSYGGMDVFAGKNAQDKFVFVKNTGKTDAYVRTIIAFEAGSKTESEWSEVIGFSNHFTWDDAECIGIVNIDGNNYEVVEFVYKGWGENRHVGGVLPAGDMTYCSLAQVYMKANATNDDVVALDGNNNGTYDILVLSQAVQAAGFDKAETALDAAFGNITTTNHPWSESAPKFHAPVMEGNEIELNEDYYLVDESFFANYDATEAYSIDGNGNTVTLIASEIVGWGEKGNMPENGTVFATENGATVTVSDVTFTGSSQAILAGYYQGATTSSYYNTVFNNVNFVDIEATGSGVYICSALMVYGKAELNNCNIYGTTISELYADEEEAEALTLCDLAVVNYSNTTINGGKIGTVYAWPQAIVTVNGAEIDTMYISGFNKGNLTVKSGSVVGSIISNYGRKNNMTIESGATVGILDLSAVTDKSACNIVIEDGANVGKIVANGVEYDSIAAWMNA